MIEHCISTLNSVRRLENENKVFQVYVTDALMAIAENTTHFLGYEGVVDYGKTITKRFSEIITTNKEEPKEEKEDTRSAQEIATDMWERIRGH